MHGPIRLLTYTTLYPNPAQPYHGLFVKTRLDAIARSCGVSVVAPVDVRATGIAARHVPSFELRDGIEVFHPRFALFPGLWKGRDGAWLFEQTYPQVRKALDSRAFDLVDAHYAYPDGYAAARLARRRGVPLVLSVRGSDLQVLVRHAGRRRAIQETIGRASAVIAVSRTLSRLVVDLGAHPSKVHVISNGIDREQFHPIDRREARARLGWDLRERVVLWVGRLHPVKGLELLLSAIEGLQGLGLGTIRCRLVGAGPYRTAVAAEIKKRLLHSVIILHPPVVPSELRYWYSAADLLCLPSLSEGCPNVVLEALACGTPVVATAVGGVPDLVRDGREGYLLPSRDPRIATEAIAKALGRTWDARELATSPALRSWSEVALAQISVYHRSLGLTSVPADEGRTP